MISSSHWNSSSITLPVRNKEIECIYSERKQDAAKSVTMMLKGLIQGTQRMVRSSLTKISAGTFALVPCFQKTEIGIVKRIACMHRSLIQNMKVNECNRANTVFLQCCYGRKLVKISLWINVQEQLKTIQNNVAVARATFGILGNLQMPVIVALSIMNKILTWTSKMIRRIGIFISLLSPNKLTMRLYITTMNRLI